MYFWIIRNVCVAGAEWCYPSTTLRHHRRVLARNQQGCPGLACPYGMSLHCGRCHLCCTHPRAHLSWEIRHLGKCHCFVFVSFFTGWVLPWFYMDVCTDVVTFSLLLIFLLFVCVCVCVCVCVLFWFTDLRFLVLQIQSDPSLLLSSKLLWFRNIDNDAHV